jgi:hypothetical protein
MIRERIFSYLEEYAQAHVVRDVRLCIGYSSVLLDCGALGVAYTFSGESVRGCSLFRQGRPFAGKKAVNLLSCLKSDHRIEIGAGLAVTNALSQTLLPEEGLSKSDVLDAITVTESDRVGMIGYLGPLVPALQGRVAELRIFEERTGTAVAPGNSPALHYDTRTNMLTGEQQYLSNCEVALITATSIINGTIDPLLTVCHGCREVALIEASTPLLPHVFRDTPVTVLSGIVVNDTEGLIRVISEGCGTRYFREYVTKVNVTINATDATS